ncbi:MAG: hypothetical protein QXU95_00995 [Candidatus Bathyarchaeia archaeon]|nr:hypothetical protein [Candidatus Bathyarchaeota archaeon]
MRKLTKEDILKGKNRRETLYIREYDAEVVIRPLTDGELTDLFSFIGNLPIKEDGTPDLSKMDISTNFEVLRRAASMGLIEPKLTMEELANMIFGVPEFIGAKVLEISGVVPEEESKKKE